MNNTRNFCIIAHIDHGKSTIADRMLEVTNTIDKRKMKEQYLDGMELERERGITVKMAPVRMEYHQGKQDQNDNIKTSDSRYILNLIDTPGHSDFSYEVSRALAAVEGAIVLVDGGQGIQAQTLSVYHKAKALGLKIIGAINKIDLFDDREDERLLTAINDLSELIEVNPDDIALISGKTGEGLEGLLDKVVSEVPSPKEESKGYSRALVFDSFYDNHKGIIAGIRIFDGNINKGDNLSLFVSKENFTAKEVGYFVPEMRSTEKIHTGEIGYVATGVKDPEDVRIGDTMTNMKVQGAKLEDKFSPLPGYEDPKPVVFVSFYPEDADKYEDLGSALQKLRLNDSSISIQQDRNEVLGRGYKVGFLGKLHFEIVVERISTEFNVEVINSFPSVIYKIKTPSGWEEITTPEEKPENTMEIQEPIVDLEVIVPPEYLNSIISMQEYFRMKGLEIDTAGRRMMITAKMPLSELIDDFDDKLKSATSGFGSFSYDYAGHETSDIVGVEIHVSKDRVPGLSRFYHRSKVETEARSMVKKLKEVLPKVQYAQPIQAISGGKILAREDVPALKKNVTGHLYGGDRTRKMKLWQKQKKGKKKLKSLGQGKISGEVFRKLLEK